MGDVVQVRSWKPITNFPVDSKFDYVELQERLNNFITEIQSAFNKLNTGLQQIGITYNSNGGMSISDGLSTVDLETLAKLSDMYWEHDGARGIKFTNKAGTEIRIGLMENGDGVTIFNNVDEVE